MDSIAVFVILAGLVLSVNMYYNMKKYPHWKILSSARALLTVSLLVMVVGDAYFVGDIEHTFLIFFFDHLLFVFAGITNFVGLVQLRRIYGDMSRRRHHFGDTEKRIVRTVVPEPARISINTDSIVVKWDIEAEKLFEFPASFAVGRSLLDLIVPADMHQGHIEGMKRFLISGELSKPYYEVPAVDAWLNRFNIKIHLSVNRTNDHFIIDASVWRAGYADQEDSHA